MVDLNKALIFLGDSKCEVKELGYLYGKGVYCEVEEVKFPISIELPEEMWKELESNVQGNMMFLDGLNNVVRFTERK